MEAVGLLPNDKLLTTFVPNICFAVRAIICVTSMFGETKILAQRKFSMLFILIRELQHAIFGQPAQTQNG